MEVQEKPVQEGFLQHGQLMDGKSDSGRNACVARVFDAPEVHLRYGVSFISQEQAAANLHREIDTFDVEKVAAEGRKVWNETLGRLEVRGGDETEKTVFYTSYYRTFERPVCLSEDGRYWSAFDNQVHEDGGTPFYTDDWIWDTYRAAHPLRVVAQHHDELDRRGCEQCLGDAPQQRGAVDFNQLLRCAQARGRAGGEQDCAVRRMHLTRAHRA
jgi:putative alpha-1,2-mannosidase